MVEDDNDDFLALPGQIPNVCGRPSVYDASFNEKAFKLCLLGATDKDLADFFGVSEQTLNTWKHNKSGFLESIKAGKDDADANVTKSLYKRAVGYSHKETKIATHMGEITDRIEIEKHYAPDTRACEYWLNNRQRSKWNNTVKTELTGKNGEPLQTMNANLDVANMSKIEKATRLINIMQKAVQKKADDVDD